MTSPADFILANYTRRREIEARCYCAIEDALDEGWRTAEQRMREHAETLKAQLGARLMGRPEHNPKRSS